MLLDDVATSAATESTARQAGELVLRLAYELEEMFRRASTPEQLEPFEARLLAAAAEQGDRPLAEFARALGSDPSRISEVVARLERRGLLRRVTARGDHRVRHLTVTADGAAALSRIGERLVVTSPLIARLTDRQRHQLVSLLKRTLGD